MNYQQSLFDSERKVIIYRKLMIQLDKRCSASTHYGNSPKRHSRKCLNCQIHQDMKLNAGL